MEVLWAKPDPTGPGFRPVRAVGAKAKGLAYQRKLAQALGPKAIAGQWFRYSILPGTVNWCQPDFITLAGPTVVILESKLSYTEEAWGQLELYKSVVREATGRECLGVQVTRNLNPKIPPEIIFPSLSEAALAAQSGCRAIWHWLG